LIAGAAQRLPESGFSISLMRDIGGSESLSCKGWQSFTST
jgi:hypothetical protein